MIVLYNNTWSFGKVFFLTLLYSVSRSIWTSWRYGFPWMGDRDAGAQISCFRRFQCLLIANTAQMGTIKREDTKCTKTKL